MRFELMTCLFIFDGTFEHYCYRYAATLESHEDHLKPNIFLCNIMFGYRVLSTNLFEKPSMFRNLR